MFFIEHALPEVQHSPHCFRIQKLRFNIRKGELPRSVNEIFFVHFLCFHPQYPSPISHRRYIGVIGYCRKASVFYRAVNAQKSKTRVERTRRLGYQDAIGC